MRISSLNGIMNSFRWWIIVEVHMVDIILRLHLSLVSFQIALILFTHSILLSLFLVVDTVEQSRTGIIIAIVTSLAVDLQLRQAVPCFFSISPGKTSGMFISQTVTNYASVVFHFACFYCFFSIFISYNY